MIEIKYNNSRFGLTHLSFVIGDNYKIKEDLLINITDFFENKSNEDSSVKILENERPINKKDFIYIKIEDENALEKEYNADKTTYARKIIEKLLDQETLNNDVLANLNTSLSESITDSSYLKEISALLYDDEINKFDISCCEINKKVLLDYILNIGYVQTNPKYSSKFAKVSAMLRIIDTYIKCLDVKKRIFLVLDEIDNKMSSSERMLLYKMLREMSLSSKFSILMFTRDVYFLCTEDCDSFDIARITLINNKVLSFANKDIVLKDILDMYPGHIELNQAIEFIFKTLVFYNNFLTSPDKDKKLLPIEIKNMINAMNLY